MPDLQMQATMETQTAKHYSAIGRVAVEWSRLESYVRETVRMLAGVDNELGECLTTQISSFEKLADTLSALSELRRQGITGESEFQSIIKSIRSFAHRRDQVVNEEWTFDPGRTLRWSVHVGNTLQKERVSTSTRQVEELADEIARFSTAFLDFRRSFLISLELWPGQ